MSEFHTIDIPDIADQDAVQRFFGEIRNPGADYLRIRDGADYCIVSYPAKKRVRDDGKVSEEENRKRWAAFKRAQILAEEVAELWCTDETAVEAVANSRR